MSQAARLQGEFKGWEDEVRNAKLGRLAAIIKRHAIAGVGTIVSNSAYRKIVRERIPQTVDHPYWLCFQRLTLEVPVMCANYTPGKVNFVFDRQGEGYERRAEMMHKYWGAVLGSAAGASLGTLSFGDERDLLPLQAADMLAWHIRRHADCAVLGIQEDRPLADALWGIPTFVRTWEPHEMHDFVTFYQANHPDSPTTNPELHEPAQRSSRHKSR